ncbi:RDD family protein [Arsenicitalea aurantiaca]|uniref:RDD family protein n=1 Tax=Arsenicitalea aurantiaca TaxID=1783274 RepID=A0A433XEL9_9HYPH|nr:RDD family protein [Arsenicitalea aurantiaca]RUT32533.1 RDD family protein [Arsenicitalea aurantiaca]
MNENRIHAALPDPATAPELFEGLLTRRVMAYVIDFFIILAIAMGLGVVGLILGVLTFGLGWLLLPVVLPLAILGYYVVTLGSPRRSTVGMSMMDLVLTPTSGAPLDGWQALAHPIIFWITIWISWPLSLLIALLTPRRQMIHDLLTGTLMLRLSPMERHWRTLGEPA